MNTLYYPQQRMEAVCPSGKVAPCANPCQAAGHGCGIYGTKDFRLTEYENTRVGHGAGQRRYTVYGQVGLWGRVYEHTSERHSGYRGQYAYPLCFYMPPTAHVGGWAGAINEAAWRYGVPVEEAPWL